MGCEVKYRISDVQRLTTSVTSPEHGLRSFGKTVLLNVLTKNTVRYDLHSSLDMHSKKDNLRMFTTYRSWYINSYLPALHYASIIISLAAATLCFDCYFMYNYSVGF